MFKKRFLTAFVMFFSGSIAASGQAFDPYNREGVEFTTPIMAMLWLGLEQGVMEQCGGNLSDNSRKLAEFTDAARHARGDSFATVLAGVFGEGYYLGHGVGCNVDKLRLYGSWAEMYYAPALSRLKN